MARYLPQMLFTKIGPAGQRRLAGARAVLIGCGGLGTAVADMLVRAGIGHLRICDRDYIELNNLHRQTLFDEDDIARNLPKAPAAAEKLGRINSDSTVESVVVDVNPANIEQLCEEADLLLDGTDNFETRFLINDLAVKTRRPWIYGAVVGATGLSMTIIPQDTPCLRCVFEEAPPPALNPTCDTVGVLSPAVTIVAGLQAIEAIKLLAGRAADVNRNLVSVDAWTGRFASISVQNAYNRGDCRCCKHGEFPYLAGTYTSKSALLCGRSAIQVYPPCPLQTDFPAIARRLQPIARDAVKHNRFMLKARIDDYELTLFPDGRAIIKGTDNTDKARSLYARYFGA
ncbi:MAG: ThiF family adenylyltransferase [Phycisphaerales bacterium]|nr:MAG: ThiF family adenylyltransferase [Phycisphaerales bacterium]